MPPSPSTTATPIFPSSLPPPTTSWTTGAAETTIGILLSPRLHTGTTSSPQSCRHLCSHAAAAPPAPSALPLPHFSLICYAYENIHKKIYTSRECWNA
ncbi:hypothetical protein C2S52_021278 [Perilla frutescens var. hirtella]|nr:hypothetical protein C2S52_021278 [Perilla frutescens var. hirtella]KAH6808235.1 hypothetical protein C2S51_029343 [Perilla frutescens var. frutescens]